MDRTNSRAGDVFGEGREHEGFWLTLAALTLTSWSLMMWTWTRHLLDSHALEVPVLRTAGLSRLLAGRGRGRARPVHRTTLECCAHPCSSGRPVNSSCGCIQGGTVNFYVNYNCSKKNNSSTQAPRDSSRGERNSPAEFEAEDLRRQSLSMASAARTESQRYDSHDATGHSQLDSCYLASNFSFTPSTCHTSTPLFENGSSFDIVSSSEVAHLL